MWGLLAALCLGLAVGYVLGRQRGIDESWRAFHAGVFDEDGKLRGGK